MKIALEIDRLTLRGVRRTTVEEVTTAIQDELTVLAEFHGMPATSGHSLELDLASVSIEPGMTGEQAGRRVARQLMSRWMQQAGVREPRELAVDEPAGWSEIPPADGAASSDPVQGPPDLKKTSDVP